MVKWFRLGFGLKSSWLKNPWLKSLELKCSGISTLPAYPVPSNITAKQSKTTAITELQPINEIPVKAKFIKDFEFYWKKAAKCIKPIVPF